MSSDASRPVGIDPQSVQSSNTFVPYNVETFRQLRVNETWAKYEGRLTWGKGQCLALLDDGCDITKPAWQVVMPWGPKVIATWNSIEENEDCMHVKPGYHGTTVGYPSSMNLDNVHGIAWQNHVVMVRCVTVVHLRQDESVSMARGLRWVRDNHKRLNITVVNLAPLDDQKHQTPVPTVVDDELKALRDLNIWVSAPAGNHHYTDGISWPACQPLCYGIGGTKPDKHEIHLDRWNNIDLLASAVATSSSNAYAAGSAQVLREAIEKTNFPWQKLGPNLPEAMMKIFQDTGVPIHDDATGFDFKELDLLAAVDFVFGE